MYLPSAIVLLCLAIHNTGANIVRQPEQCDSGYCLPKHLCPTGSVEDAPTLGQSDSITLRVDEESECGDFMKICCSASSLTPVPNDAVPKADQECGMSNPQGLVYNVESNLTYAKYAEFLWTVAIFQISFSLKNMVLTYVGGGTLIHPKFVVTAAHTLKKPHRYVARFGEWNIKSDAEIYPAQDIGIQEHILHPSFHDLCTPENDIALAVLKQSVIYTPHIRPLCLPSPQDVFDGQRCIATGWGLDVRTKQPAPIMKRIELIVVPRALCQTLYQVADADSSFRLHRSSMCARAADLQDTCDKDGGTPMACPKEDGSYVLAGITSWGLDCGKPDAPGVYVDVAKFACWITDTIEGYEELHAEE
ncbi:inactive CLIP domain-containing serine protease A8-like [Anopheles moucheti]|uniref:inactive CLIP domain-containing serine protease A8-like n=1 Tax=Anopheles moucheti TaxID=186751 RepID=UPI0022F02B9C|nr:inactive CLIP domain-containing serine protease A8-like [Anopheles moucheti]